MSLFSRKRRAQTAPEKISFDGEQPLYSTVFKLEYDDVLEGLKVAAANQPRKNRTIWGSVIFAVFALIAMPTMFERNLLLGILSAVAAIYLLVTAIFGERLARTAKAKEIAAQAVDVDLRLYKTGLQIDNGKESFNLIYRQIKMYESENAFMALVGRSMMLSFPKRYFGSSAVSAREIFIANLGLDRRYFMVGANGKPEQKKKFI